MTRVSAFITAVLLCACDGSRSRERDLEPPSDAGATAGDAAAGGDGGVNANDGGDTGGDADVLPVDGGGSICGPVGSWECGPRECHGVPACVTADLERFGWDDYVECGTGAFTEADSHAACESGPPFGDWPTAFRCGEASFRGTLRYFCAPTGSEVIVRYQVEGTLPMRTGADLLTTWSTDHWEGSGGGSGEGHLHSDETALPAGPIYFVGYHATEVPESGATPLTVWFIVESYFPDAMSERFIGGGFQVTLDSGGPTP